MVGFVFDQFTTATFHDHSWNVAKMFEFTASNRWSALQNINASWSNDFWNQDGTVARFLAVHQHHRSCLSARTVVALARLLVVVQVAPMSNVAGECAVGSVVGFLLSCVDVEVDVHCDERRAINTNRIRAAAGGAAIDCGCSLVPT